MSFSEPTRRFQRAYLSHNNVSCCGGGLGQVNIAVKLVEKICSRSLVVSHHLNLTSIVFGNVGADKALTDGRPYESCLDRFGVHAIASKCSGHSRQSYHRENT